MSTHIATLLCIRTQSPNFFLCSLSTLDLPPSLPLPPSLGAAPLLQGNCRTLFLTFLKDGESHRTQTRGTLTAFKGVTNIMSACHRLKVCVCMCVCMYVCMYVCTYVCASVYIYINIYACL